MIISKQPTTCIALGFCSLALVFPILAAATPVPTGFYIGAFGGGGDFNKSEITQSGIAIYPPGSSLGFPLPVAAEGKISSNSFGFGGIHVGYEWLTPHYPRYKDDIGPAWALVPAVELEGFYFSDTQKGRLFNDNPRLPDHRFRDKFSTQTGVVLVNWVTSLDYPEISTLIHPYVGVGLGAAIRSISDAVSAQISPPEAGINHFNSDPDGSDWTFAAQIKVGVRFNLTDYCRLFAEYRAIYLGNTDYTFGSTRYPTHVETSSWTVNLNNRFANAGAVGIDYTM